MSAIQFFASAIFILGVLGAPFVDAWVDIISKLPGKDEHKGGTEEEIRV
jgi:hypothetical protein